MAALEALKHLRRANIGGLRAKKDDDSDGSELGPMLTDEYQLGAKRLLKRHCTSRLHPTSFTCGE